jgi:hypothetical protein
MPSEQIARLACQLFEASGYDCLLVQTASLLYGISVGVFPI